MEHRHEHRPTKTSRRSTSRRPIRWPAAQRREPPAGIQGWGADLDPAMRPAVPMERTPPRFVDVHWDEHRAPALARQGLPLHRAARLTPVYGTAQPPSGPVRPDARPALQVRENDLRHWLILLAPTA
jgi:hypothetical protein